MENWYGSENSSSDNWLFSAEELRQYIYCPRIPFLRHVRKIKPNSTASMRRGTKFHQDIVRKRRKLQKWLLINDKHKFNRIPPQYYFNLYFESPTLHLLAYLDVVEKNPNTDELYPVEIKTTSNFPISRDKIIEHHLIQLTVQSLLLEEHFKTFISRAKIIYVSNELNHTHSLSLWQEISIDMKETVLKTVADMHREISSEILPRPTKIKNRCKVCEYWTICRSV